MMEVIKSENLVIWTVILISLFLDLIFGLQGLIIPAVLSFMIAYFIFLTTTSIPLFILSLIFIGVILYGIKLTNFAPKLKKSTSGFFNIDILFMPLKKILEELNHDKRLYRELSNQIGTFYKKIGENEYIISFNIGSFKGKYLECNCDELLEWGDRVKVKEVKNGTIYVEKIKNN